MFCAVTACMAVGRG